MSVATRGVRLPHVFVLLTAAVFIVSLLTYVVPAGRYATRDDKIVPGTYQSLPRTVTPKTVLFGEQRGVPEGQTAPVGVLEFLLAIPAGMAGFADIIFLIFIVGGAFGVVQRTGTILAVVGWMLDTLGRSAVPLTIVIMVVLAAGGSLAGMGEEFIPLVPVFLLISARLGLDRVYGLALVFLAAEVGFAAGTTNMFTVQVAQGIAGLDLNSGWPLRVVFFVMAITLAILHVLRYGRRIRQDPARSLAPFDAADPATAAETVALTGRHVAVVVGSVGLFALILAGVIAYGWYLKEMSGGFLLIAMVAMLAGGLSLTEGMAAFVKGMEEMVVAALVVGFAAGVKEAMQFGEILDTVIHSAATQLEHVGPIAAAEGMLLFQTTLNFLIPSGSGQAAVTMPIMAPLADLVGVTRQTAVLAYQFGDGLSNAIIPTSGILMAMLALARISYTAWLRFVAPLFLQLLVLAALFLVYAVLTGYA